MRDIKKLNLGCGKDYKSPQQGWVNLDYNSCYKVEVVHDLNKFPYPFKNSGFDYVYCSHVLEHVSDLFRTLREISRILKDKGMLHIRVPHFSNGTGYNDLSHRRFFGWFTFDYLLAGYYNESSDFKIISKRFNFLGAEHKILNRVFSWAFNLVPKSFYERFLCWIIPVGEIEIKLRKCKTSD